MKEKDPEEELEGSKQAVSKEGAEFFQSLIRFFRTLFDLRSSTDYETTETCIRKDSNFSGTNAWILGCSIVIASVGLNVNSIPVVIGAMLVSPLMGPILGTGLGMGTNDMRLIWSSLKNLGIAVAISLATSYLYFLISPIKEPSEELVRRTSPHFLDVVVAVFGGLAGIIANSRGEKSNVLPGVAIATALMPPLCTAGYGLATQRWDFFAGAFYLFLLNSVLIAAVTLIVVRYLRFPVMHFAKAKYDKYLKVTMWILTLVLVLPSGWLFYKVVKQDHFRIRAQEFVQNEFTFQDRNTVFDAPLIEYNDTLPQITVILRFGEPLTAREKQQRFDKLVEYGLEGTKLIIMQDERREDNEIVALRAQANTAEEYKKLMEKQDAIISNQEEKINSLTEANAQLTLIASDSLPVKGIQKEIAALFPGISEFSCSRTHVTDFKNGSTEIDMFIIRWNLDDNQSQDRKEDEEKINGWLKAKFPNDSIRVIYY